MVSTRTGTAAAVLATLVLSAMACAQEGEPDGAPIDVSDTIGAWQFRVLGGGQYRFRADIEGGGDFSMTRAATTVTASTRLDLDSELQVSGTIALDSYDIDAALGLVDIEPWDDIYTVTLSAAYTWHPLNDFTVGIGPIVRFAWESGADMEEGFIGGGFAFFSWEASNNLTIGAGLSVVSQIEKTEDIFPIIILNWEIADDLRLVSTRGTSAINEGGVELIYDIDDQLSVALGGGFEDREFKLDDQGIPSTPIRGRSINGVGQHTSNAFWARVNYQASPNLSFYGRAGVYLSGELQLEDDNGNDIAEQDHDDQFFLGAGFRLSF